MVWATGFLEKNFVGTFPTDFEPRVVCAIKNEPQSLHGSSQGERRKNELYTKKWFGLLGYSGTQGTQVTRGTWDGALGVLGVLGVLTVPWGTRGTRGTRGTQGTLGVLEVPLGTRGTRGCSRYTGYSRLMGPRVLGSEGLRV